METLDKKNLESAFQEMYNYIINQEDEIQQRFVYFQELQLTEQRLLQNISYTNQNLINLVEQIRKIQENINTELNKDIKKYDEFDKESKKFDRDMQNLNSQFEENILVDQIGKVSIELQVSRETEDKLSNELQKILSKKISDSYEQLTIIPTLINEAGEIGDTEMNLEKISMRENNVQFLTNQISKQLDLMEC